MPQETQLAHRNVRDTNIPYISNQSPTVTEPCYVSGSTDLLTGINGYAQRRPGFSDSVEPTPTAFVNLVREFPWDDFNGNFYVMFNDIAGGQSKVYKMLVGTDVSAVLIFTDTGSANPFDFVVSNNICYFGNGHVMKKWNPTIGVENWGIAIGSVNNATGPNTAGSGTDGGGANAWTNPSNITSNVSYATVSLTASGLNPTAFSNALLAETFGFSIPSTNTISGVGVSATAYLTLNLGNFNFVQISAQLLVNGSPVGNPEVGGILGTSPVTFNFGGSSDLWGTTLTPNNVNQTTFGVQFIIEAVHGFGGSANATISVNNGQITIYGTGGPSVTVSGSAGTFSATVGYEYVFCFGNSLTGHISSPTPVSASTGVFTNKLNVQVSLTASTDSQVDQIHVYRTTDSAAPGVVGGSFFEIPSSPYPNTTANITDNAPDAQLNVSSLAPTPTFNDRPPASFGFVYFSGRIWMITGNKVWFTGLEEIITGVPEESVPSGTAGDFWAFDQNPIGLGVAGTGKSQTLIVFCGGRLYGISGNTLDTFQRFLISNRRGCRNRTTITMLGGMVSWLDSANQIWATDGSNLQELSIPIRPDLASVTPANCSSTFHTAGVFHWLVFSTGSKIFTYDVDMEQWMPPWSFGPKYLFSGETAPGNYVLMASTGTKAVQLNAAKFNDNGSTYAPVGRTNLFSVVPDFGRRFSYIAAGIYDEPSRTGVPWFVEVDTNQTTLGTVSYLADDDPTTGTYTPMPQATTPQQAWNRNSGINIQQNVYSMGTTVARWIGLQITLQNADQLDKIYGYFLAYKAAGGK